MDELKVGARLRSQVCDTEIIVVRPPDAPIDLTCGGHAMVAVAASTPSGLAPRDGLDGGSQLGKRYTAPNTGIEVLVTKSGTGSLAVGSEPMAPKDAKPLPASD